MAQGQSVQPYIGSKLSLISNSDIRYEGTLYQLDVAASTISLSQVRSFGTEDRHADKPVAVRDEIYEFIIFRGSDIKDITICEPARPPIFDTIMKPTDPAIIEISHLPTGPAPSTRGNATRGRSTGGPGPSQRSGNNGPANPNQNQSINNERASNAGGGYNGGGRGGGMQQGRGGQNRGGQNQNMNSNRGGYGQNDGNGQMRQPRQDWAVPREKEPDFDFDASNKVLEEVEQKLRAKHSGEGMSNDDEQSSRSTTTEAKCYNPENFFDSISCEALEKRGGDGGNTQSRPGFDRNREREMNAMTFGISSMPPNRGRFFNRGGNGGRGGYRGGQIWNNNNNGNGNGNNGGGGGQNWNRGYGNNNNRNNDGSNYNGGYGGGNNGYNNGGGRGYSNVYGNQGSGGSGVYSNNNGGYRGGNRGRGYGSRGQGGQRQNVESV